VTLVQVFVSNTFQVEFVLGNTRALSGNTYFYFAKHKCHCKKKQIIGPIQSFQFK